MPSSVVATPRNFWTVAAVLMLALWASGAPSIVYPLYATRWALAPVVTTGIFTVYPLVLVVMLILFGNVSDHVGRRTTLLVGLGFLLIGTVLLALAPSIGVVFTGRVVQGLGVGLAVGAGNAALIDYNPYGRRVPGPLSSIAQSVGFTLALALGATLVQFAPDPLHLSFWVLGAAFVVCVLFAFALPRRVPTAVKTLGRWKPQGLLVPRGLGRAYVLASVPLAVGYAIGAVFLSLGSAIERVVLPGASLIESGLVLSLSTLFVALGAWMAGGVGSRPAVFGGGTVAILASAAVFGSSLTGALLLFLVSCAVGGTAGGLLAGTAVAAAPAHHRAQLLSAVFLIGYVVQGGIALAGGGIATAIGLVGAAIWIAVILTALAVFALIINATITVAPRSWDDARRRTSTAK